MQIIMPKVPYLGNDNWANSAEENWDAAESFRKTYWVLFVMFFLVKQTPLMYFTLFFFLAVFTL